MRLLLAENDMDFAGILKVAQVGRSLLLALCGIWAAGRSQERGSPGEHVLQVSG